MIRTLTILGLLTVLSPARTTADEPKAPAAPVKWEYKVMAKTAITALGEGQLAAGLNKLGEDGWELVAVDDGTNARLTEYVFKRPKANARAAVEDIQGRIKVAEADVQIQQERTTWTKRMAEKGFMSAAQAEAEAQRLREFEAELEKLRKQLNPR